MGLRFQLEDFPLFFFVADSAGGLIVVHDGLFFGTCLYRVLPEDVTDDWASHCRFGERDFLQCLKAALRGELPPGYPGVPPQ